MSGSAKALSTVTAIIDGMGSCGAALGPLLTGHLAALPGGFDNVFYMLYAASAAAAALLARLVVREVGLPRINMHVNCSRFRSLDSTRSAPGWAPDGVARLACNP